MNPAVCVHSAAVVSITKIFTIIFIYPAQMFISERIRQAEIYSNKKNKNPQTNFRANRKIAYACFVYAPRDVCFL